MIKKIKEAITQGYKNLGVPETVIDGLAALGKTVVKEDSEIDAFVKGEAVKGVMKSYQSEADKVRTEYSAKLKGLETEKAELEARLKGDQPNPNPEPPKPEPQPQDMAKIIADAVAAAIKPISDELAGFKAEKTVNDTVATVDSRIDSWGYGKGYPKEMEKAKRNAMELFDAYGKTWTADELEAKIKEKFNMEVREKGVDTTKPFVSDGGGRSADEANKAFADEIRKALGKDKE